MPTEPIRPDDHSIIGEQPEIWLRGDGPMLPGLTALAEAIHQAFERDADVAYYADKKITGYQAPGDPDTEIDRIARLLVDGEYRRRNAETENTP